jgi:uncharacterized phage infection (PIP) family protein YhgE
METIKIIFGGVKMANENLKLEHEELKKENEALHESNRTLDKQLEQAQKTVSKIDKMLGRYMELLKDAEAKIVYFEVDIADLKESFAKELNEKEREIAQLKDQIKEHIEARPMETVPEDFKTFKEELEEVAANTKKEPEHDTR